MYQLLYNTVRTKEVPPSMGVRSVATINPVEQSQPVPKATIQPPQRSIFFHFYTLWLFAVRDIPCLVLPQTAFGICTALSGELLTTNASPCLGEVLQRIPQILLWNWLNVVLFSVSNQRLPGSIAEDTINKPWRPLPAKRLTAASAQQLLFYMIPLVFGVSLILGGKDQAVALMVMTWMYNDLGGAERYILRNLLNAFGIVCYGAASSAIATGHKNYELSGNGYSWLCVVWGAIATTIHVMDLADMEGDRVCKRRTIPIVFGEEFTRRTIVVAAVVWSLVCPTFLQLGLMGYIMSCAAGGIFAARVYFYRGVREDKKNFKIFWSLWMAVLYSMPLWRI